MSRSEEITQQFEAISFRILQNSRNELYLNMRFLDLALSSLEFRVTTELSGIGTDGFALFVHPKVLADLYEQDRKLVNRIYLHTVYHCLFRHLLKTGKYPERLWNISCDMAVETLMDGMNYRCVRMGGNRYRMNWQERLQKERKVLTAEGICHYLMQAGLQEYELRRLETEYGIDDHSLWPKAEPPGSPPPPQMEVLQNKWQDVSEKTQTEMETFAKEASQGAGDLLEEMQVANRERYDYRSFLRKFAVMKEEMQVDPDTFDYVFYSYGLSLYGNMPLIEPQEYKEVHKIEEFVIVIDVSMSCSGELVRTFLEQTYAVLTESESYLRKVNIRILQCDEQVRADQKITSQKELKDYMEHFELMGNGGTDFCPAFDYVNQLIEQKELLHLKGMLYFTDGYGTFPKRRPPYDAAFVFMEEDYTDAAVPPWAIKLILEKEDLEENTEFQTDRQFIWEEDQK
ncbi:MAG: VWA-like domain-containing protein [Lachnospiraceae bacterium]|nr:VWA-like domain-containing protein [Lachnospiraceae bacterium]